MQLLFPSSQQTAELCVDRSLQTETLTSSFSYQVLSKPQKEQSKALKLCGEGRGQESCIKYTWRWRSHICNTPKLRLSTGLQDITPDHDVPCKVSQQIPWELFPNTGENQRENYPAFLSFCELFEIVLWRDIHHFFL